jgi:DeoR/GlpR family transcriptional regulator of sugar metabolism
MSPHPQPRKIDARRQLIFRRAVLDNRPLSLKKVQELLKDPSYKKRSAERDIKMFEEVGCVIELQRSATDPTDYEFVFVEGPHTDDVAVRKRINVDAKTLVAQLTASLICGVSIPSDRTRSIHSMNAKEILKSLEVESIKEKSIRECLQLLLNSSENQKRSITNNINHTADQILRLIRQCEPIVGGANWRKIQAKLYTFWEEPSRAIAIDSGTTNIILADLLKEIDIPLRQSKLCSLTVCTNSREIFQILGPSRVWIKTVIVGGMQKFRSSTIAGAIAEQFIRSVSMLQFGMSVIGSTRIDLERLIICTDSQEEAAIKNLFMDRSALRIVCIDNSKLQKTPGREAYRFASIDPAHVDLIVTNSPMKREDSHVYREFLDCVNQIQLRGVPVLVATSPQTFGYKYGAIKLISDDENPT